MAKAPLTRPLLLDPPWLPVPYDKSTVAALQQLAAGKANEGQQKMALDWIIYQAAGTYDLSFRSDPSGIRRASSRANSTTLGCR